MFWGKERVCVHIWVREKRGTSYSWGTDEMQAGEIKVRNLQELDENTGRRARKACTAIFFSLFPFWRFFFPGEK